MSYDFDNMSRRELLDICKRNYLKCFKCPDGFSFIIGFFYELMIEQIEGSTYIWIEDESGNCFYVDETHEIRDFFRSEPEPSPNRFSVIIAGTRSFKDYDLLEQKCNMLFINKSPTNIICGCAEGADTLGKMYGDRHGIPVQMYPADWKKYGKSAGYIRNQEMANHADALIVFWNGSSRGTYNMIETARKKEIPVRIIKYTKEE